MLRTIFIGSKNGFNEMLAHWLAQHTELVGIVWVRSTAWHSPSGGQKECACPFLSEGEPYRCSIYPTRPLVCRHFANGGSACRELRAKHGLAVAEVW